MRLYVTYLKFHATPIIFVCRKSVHNMESDGYFMPRRWFKSYKRIFSNTGPDVCIFASRGAGAQSVTVNTTGCGFEPHSIIYLNRYVHTYFHFFALVSKQSAALNSAPQHAMPLKFGGKWRTKCLNTRIPLPTLLWAGYSVTLYYFFYIYF